MSAVVDHVDVTRVQLGAASSAPDEQTRAYYLAAARCSLMKAKEAIASLEIVLLERERHAAASAVHAQQFALDNSPPEARR
jgi:hypothetical protein